jgi:hypothetical protein
MKVGDLVRVAADKEHKLFTSIALEICGPEQHPNNMHLVKVLYRGTSIWYPITFVEVISESR